MDSRASRLIWPSRTRWAVSSVVKETVSSCGTLVHFGAVVADAPSPLSTPRSAAGQAQLRLGKPLRMKCRASPVLLFNARRKSSLRHCWDCPRYSPFSRGARRAGADQGCVRVADRAGGAQARSLPNFNNPARLFPGTAGPSEPTLAAVPDGALLPSS